MGEGKMSKKAISKKVVIGVLCLIIVIGALVAVYFTFYTRLASPAGEVIILMTQPLTGPNAVFGESCRRGAMLAVDEINSMGGVKSLGGAKLKLVVIDNRGTPDYASMSLEDALHKYNVSIVLGSILSDVHLAVTEITHRYDIPNLSTASTESIYTRGYDNLFCLWPTTTQQITAWPRLLKYLSDNFGAVKKVALLYMANAYGRALGGGMKGKLIEQGFEIVFESQYDPNIQDVAPLITQVKGSGAEVVVAVSYMADGILIYRAMHTLGVTIPFITGMPTYQIDWNNTLGELG